MICGVFSNINKISGVAVTVPFYHLACGPRRMSLTKTGSLTPNSLDLVSGWQDLDGNSFTRRVTLGEFSDSLVRGIGFKIKSAGV